MKWKAPVPFNEFVYHKHFLWFPVQIDSDYFWLCTVWRYATKEGTWNYREHFHV